ncbi:geranylgeranylglyceryl/heptaprenylglyceryl phosphate synthase [soil metagenome]
MNLPLNHNIVAAKQLGHKLLAVLIDPDKGTPETWQALATAAAAYQVDLLLVGGSLMVHQRLEECVRTLKAACTIPIVLFPGSPAQITPLADGILLLSLISGRNPELLIGQHVQAAPLLKASGLETLPTGYILIDGGAPTTVSYISNTLPIPANKPEIAAITALAGEQLGLRLIYLEAGSGAINAISIATIIAVKAQINVPLIVGGGIRSGQAAYDACKAGADIIVIGTAFEEEPGLLAEIAGAVKRSYKLV